MPTFRHGRGTRILVSEFDLSTYFKDASMASTVDTPESTAFQSDTKTYVVGMTDGRFSLGGMFSGDANGVDEVFSAAFGDETPVIFTYAPEGLAVGRKVWGAAAIETSYGISGSVSDIVAVSAEFQGTGGVRSGWSLASPDTPISADGNGTVVDTGSAFTGAAYAVLHVLSNASTQDATISVMHATSAGGVYASLGSFNPVTAGDITAQKLVIPSGSLRRYVRIAASGGIDGDIAAHVSFIRSTAA